MWRMLCDSIATASSTSNSTLSELLRAIIFFSPLPDVIETQAAAAADESNKMEIDLGAALLSPDLTSRLL
ncbi:hypothetical protein GQ55_1G001500 [Panicum hallii var. hallii]|uniref:Uncharacterized protein n=1 Tax=Panicum hallii var. hallii TaxID=1504633 RepID=A0A2T7F0M3_9POAL|nr:hypothetical protein GQ55_1G001500 [Panicum hallii var. hallii]